MKKLLLSLSFLPLLAFAQAVLPTSWSFVNPSPTGASSSSPTGPATTYNTKPGWSTKLDNFVTGATPFSYATGADGNAAGRLDAQDEYIMIAFAEKPGNLTYQIKGTSISAPYFSGSFKVQESVDGVVWTDAFEHTSMTNTFASHSVALLASSRFVRFYYTTKVSGSNVALDNITLNAPPAPPLGLAVSVGTTTLANGTTFVNGNATTTSFTIQNIGNLQSLIIDSVILSGTNATDYSFGTNMDTVLASSSKSIDLTFTPLSNGSRFAKMRIYSNDVDRNPFVVNLYGIGGTLASEPSQVPTLVLQNVKTFGLDVKYGPSSNAEGYIVLRKKGGTITEVPADGISYKRGDTIGGAQVAYVGADTLAVKPTYILANTSYSFAAFAFSGPVGYENYNTTGAPMATNTTPNGSPGNYYASVNASVPSFISDLNARIKAPHDTVFYGNYAATLVNNFLTRDTLGGKRVVNCVYTGEAYIYDEPFLWWGNTGNGTLTREHTFAQSWMPSNTGGSWPEVGGKEVLEYNDQHHLFPTNQLTANVKRSNNPFGIVANPTYTSPTGQGKLGTDVGGKTVYQPTDDQKGDLARALFYMLVRYNGDRGNVWRLPTSQDIPTLLLWHQQDPPSNFEIARNEYIASVQHNRNPFIDHPEWVNRINFATLTYIPDSGNTQSITITAPIGGEVWFAEDGQKDTITWASAGIDSVSIELLVRDSAVKTLGYAKAAVGLFLVEDSLFNGVKTAGHDLKISIRSLSDSSLSSTSPNPFSIIRSDGLNELLNTNNFSVFPNPSSGMINLEIKATSVKSGMLFITDIAGRLILAKEIDSNTTIELAQQGVYFIKLQTENGAVVKKVIIE
jgi:hypothetical protein